VQMEPLIIWRRMILRNPPEKPQALRSAVTNAKWALWHSVRVPPTLSELRSEVVQIEMVRLSSNPHKPEAARLPQTCAELVL